MESELDKNVIITVLALFLFLTGVLVGWSVRTVTANHMRTLADLDANLARFAYYDIQKRVAMGENFPCQ